MYFTPKIFPEMTVYFDYQPEEPQTWDDPGCPEEFVFTEIDINDKVVGQDLADHLVETFSDTWIDELKGKRFEGSY